MANPYAVQVLREDGTISLEGSVDFTDEDNQPGSGPPDAPYTSPESGSVSVAVDSLGHVLIDASDAAGGPQLRASDNSSGLSCVSGLVETFGALSHSGAAEITGDVALDAGLVVGGVIVKLTALPAADPHVVGQLFTTAGVVHVSAG